MIRTKSRRDNRLASRRARQPSVEGLEGRLLLYGATGAQWSHPELITYSFVPDGTNIAGVASNLDAAMAARGIPTQAWQDQFRRAAATWAQYTGINIVEVSDNGAPYATPGFQQGDPRFGDIRIGGTPMGYAGLAMAWAAPPYNGGTLAGDINFNTSPNIAWNLNASYDILTVAIHEFGHALGLGHSDGTTLVGMPPGYDPYTAMYSYYTWVKPHLTPDDVAGIQAIYGLRAHDIFDAAGDNSTPATASDVTSYLDSSGRAKIAGLNINHAQDYDTYSVIVPPTHNGKLSVTVQSTGLSSLSPRLQLYNGAGVGIEQVSAPNDTYGGTLTINHNGVSTGQKYYIRVLASNGGPTGAGDYGLLINFGGGTMSPINPPYIRVPSHPDNWGLWSYLSPNDSDEGPANAPGSSEHGQPQLLSFGSLQGAGELLKIPSRRSSILTPPSGVEPWAAVSDSLSTMPGLDNDPVTFTLDAAPALPTPEILNGTKRSDRKGDSLRVFDAALQDLVL